MVDKKATLTLEGLWSAKVIAGVCMRALTFLSIQHE